MTALEDPAILGDAFSPEAEHGAAPGPCKGADACPGCPEKIVCPCFGISEATIVGALAHEPASVKDLCRLTQAGMGCMACRHDLRRYIDQGRAR